MNAVDRFRGWGSVGPRRSPIQRDTQGCRVICHGVPIFGVGRRQYALNRLVADRSAGSGMREPRTVADHAFIKPRYADHRKNASVASNESVMNVELRWAPTYRRRLSRSRDNASNGMKAAPMIALSFCTPAN